MYPEDSPIKLSPRQLRIVTSLSQLVGEGPALFFRDACDLVAEEPQRATASHLASHALREVESAVRAVLQTERISGHRESILSILQALDIPVGDIDAEFWLSIAGQGNARALHARAHRPGLDLPRPTDREFKEFVRDMESLLERVLDRFRRSYVEVFARLDRLLAIESPSARNVEELRQRIPANQVSHEYFFRNASAAWVRPLTAAGCFASPPDPQVGEDGLVSFLRWPQTEYLVRVVHEDPQGVLAAALQVPRSDNSYVIWHLAEIAIALPADGAVELVPTIVASIPGRHGVIASDEFGQLVAALARAGHITPALELAKALLADPPRRTGRGGTLRQSEFAELLRESVPILAARAGEAMLKVLVEVLDGSIARSANASAADSGYDGSQVWRAAIERNDSVRGDDPQNALVDAVRAAALQAIEEPDASVTDVVGHLDQYHWLVFRRLTLDLLRRAGEAALPLAVQRVTDRSVAVDDALDREFLLLARQVAPKLGDHDRQRYLRMIDEGPHIDRWTDRHRRRFDKEPGPAELAAYVGCWTRDRLAALDGLLNADRQTALRMLSVEHGQAPDPAVPPPPTFAVWGDEGTVSVEDLAAMDTDVLVAFLRAWRPPPDWRMIDRSSLRGPLAGAMQKDAARRSADAEQFIGLQAGDITSVLDGLWQGADQGQPLDWTGLLPLCAWVNSQATAELAQGTTTLSARQWRRARLGVLRLLIAGARNGPSRLPADADDRAWRIIRSCADDPDPSEAEESATANSRHVDNVAADTIRPVAIRAAIECGRLAQQRDTSRSVDPVLDLLERHLDAAAEPSAAVRAIYGSHVQTLLLLDKSWTQEHLEQIFPPDPNQARYWRASWNAHLQRQRITDETWHLLRPQYVRAVGALRATPEDEWNMALMSYLGHHLLTRYWSADLTLDDPDQLVQRFYDHAPAELAQQIIANLGTSTKSVAEVDGPLRRRLMRFWDYRRSAVEAGADPEELAAFDEWFTSGQFDEVWSLQQLLYVTVKVNEMTLDRDVLARLEQLAPSHPWECLAIVNSWLEHRPNYWDLSFNRSNLSAIVATGAASGDEAARSLAREVASNAALAGLYLGGNRRTDAE